MPSAAEELRERWRRVRLPAGLPPLTRTAAAGRRPARRGRPRLRVGGRAGLVARARPTSTATWCTTARSRHRSSWFDAICTGALDPGHAVAAGALDRDHGLPERAGLPARSGRHAGRGGASQRATGDGGAASALVRPGRAGRRRRACGRRGRGHARGRRSWSWRSSAVMAEPGRARRPPSSRQPSCSSRPFPRRPYPAGPAMRPGWPGHPSATAGVRRPAGPAALDRAVLDEALARPRSPGRHPWPGRRPRGRAARPGPRAGRDAGVGRTVCSHGAVARGRPLRRQGIGRRSSWSSAARCAARHLSPAVPASPAAPPEPRR